MQDVSDRYAPRRLLCPNLYQWPRGCVLAVNIAPRIKHGLLNHMIGYDQLLSVICSCALTEGLRYEVQHCRHLRSYRSDVVINMTRTIFGN